MGLNLKFFRKNTYILIMFLLGCNTTELKNEQPVVDNKLLVIVDQSESVEFVSKSTTVDNILLNAFQTTYKNVTIPTEFYKVIITGETNVIPLSIPFMEEMPDVEAMGAITYRQKYTAWRSARRKWMTNGIDDIKKTIYSQKSGYTDVYRIFKCLDITTSNMKPVDTLHVVFFSDMKHSTKNFELETLLRNKNPESFAKQEFRRLAIKKMTSKFHCLITIVTPNNFKSSDVIVKYWESFLKEWGLTNRIDWK